MDPPDSAGLEEAALGPHGTLVTRVLLTLVIMLAEGILTRLIYRESCQQEKPHKSPASSKDQEATWRHHLVDNPKLKGFDGPEKKDEIPAGSSKAAGGSWPQRKAVQEVPVKDHTRLVKGTVSPALHIPKREPSAADQLDLYTSWSCNSIYHNYPDLHIGGDHVGEHACDSGCVLEHVSDGLPDGPVLLSADIPLGQSPLGEHPEKPSTRFLSGDEAGERSIILCEEPLSNSVLNKYMETKVAELYKQFFEENLTRCGSVTNLLACSWLRNNLNQISLQLSHEQNIETSKAREVLLQSLALFSLRSAAHRNSSEFSTPNLQFSNSTGVTKKHFMS